MRRLRGASAAKAPVSARDEVITEAGRRRILVMDDEEIVRDVASNMLEILGYEAVVTTDGEAACRLFLEAMDDGRPFDAVIMDLVIPGGMGGREALSRMKEAAPDVRAVVSSGSMDDPIMAEYRRHGFMGIVVKPYKLSDMSEALHAVFGDEK